VREENRRFDKARAKRLSAIINSRLSIQTVFSTVFTKKQLDWLLVYLLS